jgi:CubicO group peptidase (beta-lactamase class C family)
MELVQGVLSQVPGAAGAYVYSNAGFAMVGAMAERRTDTAWEELMQQRLFAPLGITTAGFGAPGDADAVDQPRGHHAGGRVQEPGRGADNPAAIGPAGTVHLSLADWAKFVALHADASGCALLAPETMAKLHTPGDGPGEKYAMGWIVAYRPWAKGGEDGEGLTLTHGGSNTMWFVVVWIAPERNLAFLAATNKGGNDAVRACDEVIGALIRHHEGR